MCHTVVAAEKMDRRAEAECTEVKACGEQAVSQKSRHIAAAGTWL
jgi:hypothetical protein